MASEQARARRRAQRATAKAVRANRRQLPRQTTQRARETRREYLERMLAHPEQRPVDKSSPEGKSLAREAGLARWHKSDARYLDFQDYWYHKNDEDSEDEQDFYDDYEDEEAV